MKQRFSSLDVKVIAHELSEQLCSLRLANAYDLSSRIFLLKFHKPGHRDQLLIDSGFRCHLTSFARTTAAAPSAFVSRLRKFLKTRRVTAVQQVGTDRIIEFAFSDGMYRLFLEFYAGGNVILTDKDLKVLALLRRVPAGAGEEEIREGMAYSVENRQNYHGAPPLTLKLVKTGLQKQLESAGGDAAPGKKARKQKQGNALRRALAVAVPDLPPVLLDHAFRVRQFDASTPPEEILKSEDKLQRLLDVLEEAKQQSDEIVATTPSRGYIIARPAKQRPSAEPKSTDVSDGDKENIGLIYEDFHPFRPRQFEDDPENRIIEIVGFNKAVDDFFSSLESQKLESRLTERELAAQRKIESARQDHQKRLGGLQQVQELNVRKAQALEANLQRVEEATAAVNGLIAQGMDWEDIARLIETEQARHNPVAEIIKLPLKLQENTVTLVLGEEERFEDEGFFDGDKTESEASEDEEDEDEDKENGAPKENKQKSKDDKVLSVDVDLALSAWANASNYYDQKRTAAVKEEKTLQASEAALKRHERKVEAELKKGLAQEKQVLRAVRPQLWFEKFFYFISSEGYLVLGARDETQADLLYKRHMSKGDVWVHADLAGAAHIVVKNKSQLIDSPIPPGTLAQAGTFCVSSSEAWDSKAIMGAWWVDVKQVTKLAPTGDYLGVGAFEIKGSKNHLPPAQLLLGFGVMFKVSDASKARHMKHRIPLDGIDAKPEAHVETQESEPSETNATEDGSVKLLGTTDEQNHETDAEQDCEDHASATESEREDRIEISEQYHNPLQTHSAAPVVHEDNHDSDDSAEAETVQDHPASIGGGSPASPEPGQEASSVDTSTPPRQPQQAGNKQSLPIRGKHGKKAKIKSKYAWQDEEDRALALRLLGSTKGAEKKASETESKAAKEAADALAKERRREQHRRAQQSGKEAEEARQRRLAGMKSSTVDDEESEEGTGDVGVIENYVGKPLPGDEIEDVLVVCAPWDAVGARLRWRAKMQPGSMKKGKAVKEMLGGWRNEIETREKKRMPAVEDDRFAEEKMLRREGELIKALKDVEVVGIVPVKSCRVTVSAGGGGGGGGKEGGKGKGGGGGGGKGGRGGRGSKKAR